MATIKDRNVGWLRKLVYYPVNVAEALYVNQAGGTTPTGLATITSRESATSFISQVGVTSTMNGLQVSAVADGIDFYRVIPYDLDPNKNIGITAIWTKDASGGTHITSLTWKVKYTVLNIPQIGASGGGFGGTLGVASTTALNTAITAQTVTSTDSMVLYASPRGIITPTAVTSTNGWWALQCTLSTFTASGADKVWLLGLVVDYNVRKTTGLQASTAAPLLQNYMDASPSPSSTFTP